MSHDLSSNQAIHFTMTRESGRLVEVSTNSLPINHFLKKVKLSLSYNTWVNYAHDLKVFFSVVGKPPDEISRADCVIFMGQQDQTNKASMTINRRLAAVSSLFNELNLLDPIHFPQNPVNPTQSLRKQETRRGNQSLYRALPERVPDIIRPEDLRTFFDILPTWRDRTIMLLMWISCLRISEALNIRFQDIECSHRKVHIARGKGGDSRTVFMDRFTFAALNKYLDEERRNLFAEEDAIFVAFKGKARGRPLTENAWQHLLDYYADRCGLSHLHAHLFRHTGITHLVEGGMSEAAIRKLVGHKHANSLEPYLHLSDTFVASEFEKAEEIVSPTNWLQFPLEGVH